MAAPATTAAHSDEVWVRKQGRVNRAWRRRLLRLEPAQRGHGAAIAYFISGSDKTPRGRIPLQAAEVVLLPDVTADGSVGSEFQQEPARKWPGGQTPQWPQGKSTGRVALTTPGRTFFFSFERPEQAAAWCAAVRAACLQGEQGHGSGGGKQPHDGACLDERTASVATGQDGAAADDAAGIGTAAVTVTDNASSDSEATLASAQRDESPEESDGANDQALQGTHAGEGGLIPATLPEAEASLSMPPMHAELSTTSISTSNADQTAPSMALGGGRPLAVRLEVMEALLVAAAEAGLDPATASTTDVCRAIVLPATGARRCAYAELLPSESPLLGAATHFVSHAWGGVFAMCVAALRDVEAEVMAAGEPPPYFWFDLAVNNQHSAPERPFEWWCTTFRDSITAIGRVVLVLSPWRDPLPLTRAWCLWEVFCAASVRDATSPNTAVSLDVRLPPAEARAFERALANDMRAALDTMVRVRAERAQAFYETDRNSIFRAIEASAGGFATVNAIVKDQLRQWLVRVALAAAERQLAAATAAEAAAADSAVISASNAAVAVACASVDAAPGAGSSGAAHARLPDRNDNGLRQEEKEEEDIPSSPHAAALAAADLLEHVAVTLFDFGDFNKALVCASRAVDIYRTRLGEAHAVTGAAVHNLARMCAAQGQYNQALQHYQLALKIKRAALGEDHPASADTLNNMGVTLKDMGRLEEALEFFLQALAIRERHGGGWESMNRMRKDMTDVREPLPGDGDNEQTSSGIGALASDGDVADSHKGDSEATGDERGPAAAIVPNEDVGAPVCDSEELMPGDERQSHVRAASLANAVNNSGETLGLLGRYDEALAYQQRALDIRCAALGEHHPDTASSHNNIATIHFAQGRLEEACGSFEHALAALRAALGDTHPSVASTLNNLAVLYERRGDHASALKTHTQVLAAKRASLGEGHPSTATTLHNMGNVYLGLGQTAEALEHYRQARALRQAALGDSHPSTANTDYNLAVLLARQGDTATALTHAAQAHRSYLQVYGPDHADTKEAAARVAALEQELDQGGSQSPEQAQGDSETTHS